MPSQVPSLAFSKSTSQSSEGVEESIGKAKILRGNEVPVVPKNYRLVVASVSKGVYRCQRRMPKPAADSQGYPWLPITSLVLQTAIVAVFILISVRWI